MFEEQFLTPEYILADIETQNYDDFGFTFETNEDGSFKKAKFNWKKLDPAIWQWVFLMRGELIKAHRKERDQYRKKIEAVEKREEYKAELNRCMEKNKRQKKDNHYQERTCALYRKILERFVDLPCESE